MQRATAMPPRKVQYYDKVIINDYPSKNHWAYCTIVNWIEENLPLVEGNNAATIEFMWLTLEVAAVWVLGLLV